MSPFQFLRYYLKPRYGRFTEAGLRHLGEHLSPPAFLAFGPFLLLIDIPKAMQAQDEPPSLEEINKSLRRSAEALQD